MNRPHKRRPLSAAHKAAISRAQTGRPGYWTGLVLPASTIEKMRKAKQGRTLPLAHRQNIASGSKDKVVSEATRIKMRQLRHTEQTILKMSEAQQGPKAHAWRGGITPPKRLERARLRGWRKRVLARDGHRCQWPRCGATESRGKSKGLHAHHIQSFTKFPELRYELSNGITLCRDHHREADRLARLARRSEAA